MSDAVLKTVIVTVGRVAIYYIVFSNLVDVWPELIRLLRSLGG